MTWLAKAIISGLFFLSAECTNPPTVYNAEDHYRLEVGETLNFTFPTASKDGGFLRAHLGSSVYKNDGHFKRCLMGSNELDVCLQWGSHIVNVSVVDNNCQSIETEQPGDDGGELYMCFKYDDAQWYGGPERWRQDWPVQSVGIKDKPFLTGYDSSQSVAEPFWFNSDGGSIHVSPEVPLFTDSNDRYPNELCLIARNAEPYNPRNKTVLRIEVCQWGDPVAAQRNATIKYFGIPIGRPADEIFKEPIYSTWVRYGRSINQDKLKTLVDEIKNQSYPIGQIEIDDTWEPCYGAYKFDTNRFPNISEFTSSVHSQGGRVTAWIYPFINQGCNPSYQEALDKGLFILDQNGNSTMKWWCGTGGAIDFTKDEASEWWVQRTKDLLKSSGLDSYKFDAGETVYLPSQPKLAGDEYLVPNNYVRKYVEATSKFAGFMEVRVARGTQDMPTLVRMLDKDSRFGLDNGLHSVITTLFQMNMAGYSFVLPDMIGGNAYGNSISKELFIRWLQACTFMPALQFSMVPWDYDAETVEISRRYLALHTSYAPMLIAAAEKAVVDGTPINTPIWWIAPKDLDALKCSDEYLLAGTVLVAPIIEEGAVQRDIYLPNGTWLDPKSQRFQGPTWIRNYTAPLDTLPYFTLVTS